MSQVFLEINLLEAFNKFTNSDPNLNDLDNYFEYIFPIFLFFIYDVDWEPSAKIDKSK